MTQNNCYASVFASFKTAEERQTWMIEHVINQSVPRGGPVYSFSQEKESHYRDLSVELLEALIDAHAKSPSSSDRRRYGEIIAKAERYS